MLHKSLEPRWIKSENGNVPSNALEAGKLANGEILYAGINGQSFGVVSYSYLNLLIIFYLIFHSKFLSKLYTV